MVHYHPEERRVDNSMEVIQIRTETVREMEKELLMEKEISMKKGLAMELKGGSSKKGKSRDLVPCMRGLADASVLLTIYLAISTGFNINMLFNVAGTSMNYYAVNLVANALGLVGVLSSQSSLLFVFGCYMLASFMLSSFIGITCASVVLRSDVCMSVKDFFGADEIYRFCVTDPGCFKLVAIGAVLFELGLEMFVLYLIKLVYDHAAKDSNEDDEEKLPVGKLGSIAIIAP